MMLTIFNIYDPDYVVLFCGERNEVLSLVQRFSLTMTPEGYSAEVERFVAPNNEATEVLKYDHVQFGDLHHPLRMVCSEEATKVMLK